jgi:hypothetical protein
MLKTVNKIIKISSRESLGWERALSYELSMFYSASWFSHGPDECQSGMGEMENLGNIEILIQFFESGT